MACVSMAGMHAVARVPTRVAYTRRPFETTRVSLDDAREPSALAGFILFTSSQTARASAHRAVHLDRPGTKARACSPRHANAQTLGDGTEQRVYTFGSRSRSQSICSPQVRASLVLACLRFLLPFCCERAEQLTLFDANLKHSESPKVYAAERWIKMVRTLRNDARSQRPIRLHRSRCPSTACKTHLLTFIPPQGVAPVCSECETTETSRWYANRDDKDIPACGVCYNRQVCHARRPHTSIFHNLCVVTS
jgi:hypothetical protein